MSNIVLPARPSLEQLKKQARELLDAIRAGDPEAAALFAGHHPAKAAQAAQFALHDAQLVLARQYGFPSWPALKEEVERLSTGFSERAKRFVTDATGGNIARARRALAAESGLGSADSWTALVTGDLSTIRRAIERDAAWVNSKGGPRAGWTPLHYVSFSRFQMENSESRARFTECAQALLDAGADPNAAWENPSWPGAPLKSLYGAVGENNNPLLAALLLERGAEIDDGESVYHAAEHHHLECLEVLWRAGVSLGRHHRWKNTPLYFLLGTFVSMEGWSTVPRGIRWLLDHGSDPNIACGENDETALHLAIRQDHAIEIIRWLLERGADPNRPDKNGVVPMRLARRAGRKDVIALLQEHGAQDVELPLKERFFEAVFSGEGEEALRILREHPDLPSGFDEDDRLALNRAAERGNTRAIEILLDAGFDMAFKGTRDWGSTPLHISAWYGQAAAVELLLARGSPIKIIANPPAEGLALGWAAHGSGHCQNPKGDYPRVVRALLAAGLEPLPDNVETAAPEVAEIILAAMTGNPQ